MASALFASGRAASGNFLHCSRCSCCSCCMGLGEPLPFRVCDTQFQHSSLCSHHPLVSLFLTTLVTTLILCLSRFILYLAQSSLSLFFHNHQAASLGLALSTFLCDSLIPCHSIFVSFNDTQSLDHQIKRAYNSHPRNHSIPAISDRPRCVLQLPFPSFSAPAPLPTHTSS